MDEALIKSIDDLIDGLFVEEAEGENVEKSMIKDMKAPATTADEVKPNVEVEDDEKRKAGRPKQISEVPETDTDGKRSGNYDASVTSENSDAKKKEDKQVAVPEQMKKALTDDEFAEYQSLKKAQAERAAAETLQKARQETADLIKSAVGEAVAAVKAENADLRKSLDEQSALIKAMANKPQKSKAVTGVNAVEKFQKSESNTLSKAEVLDVAEDLMKSGKLTLDHVVELENNSFIFDSEARSTLEREIARRNR